MNPALRHQLAHLDRTLLAILNERARLLRDVDPGDPSRAAAVEDLLRRNAGPFPAEALRRVFRDVDEGCLRAGPDADSRRGDPR